MGRKVYLTRRERFNAAHKLWNPDWSVDKNREVYGKCANENWHGHNYELFVTVTGEPSKETGLCVDLKDLSSLIQRSIIEKLDHLNLNIDVKFMRGKITSTENLVLGVWEELEKEFTDFSCTLHCIEIRETENNYVKYYGEDV